MATDTEIMEGNKLIAEFMGWKKSKKSYHYYYPLNSRRYYSEKQILYESSWDWLMPVVTKIGEIHNQADIELAAKIEDANLPMFNTSIFCHFDALYKRIVQFIQWYTQNPTTP